MFLTFLCQIQPRFFVFNPDNSREFTPVSQI
jgi:hypothetical protein